MSYNQTQISPPPEFGEITSYIWSRKLTLAIFIIIFAVLGVAIAILSPNVYRANALLIPTQVIQEGGNQMSSRLGGLAALAGIGSGNGNIKSEMAEAKLLTKEFSYRFFDDHDLIVALVAAEGWDAEKNELIYDPEVYNPETKKFLFEHPVNLHWEAYKVYSENLLVDKEKTGLINLSYEHYSPHIAKYIVDHLVMDINRQMKAFDIAEANKSIEYLSDKLTQTKVADMQVVFYKLIEEQTKNKMLTEIKDEYIFTTIDPALVPEEKAGPRRALICIVMTMLGGILGVFVLLISFYRQR